MEGRGLQGVEPVPKVLQLYREDSGDLGRKLPIDVLCVVSTKGVSRCPRVYTGFLVRQFLVTLLSPSRVEVCCFKPLTSMVTGGGSFVSSSGGPHPSPLLSSPLLPLSIQAEASCDGVCVFAWLREWHY